jgi:hypothetical protein
MQSSCSKLCDQIDRPVCSRYILDYCLARKEAMTVEMCSLISGRGFLGLPQIGVSTHAKSDSEPSAVSSGKDGVEGDEEERKHTQRTRPACKLSCNVSTSCRNYVGKQKCIGLWYQKTARFFSSELSDGNFQLCRSTENDHHGKEGYERRVRGRHTECVQVALIDGMSMRIVTGTSFAHPSKCSWQF